MKSFIKRRKVNIVGKLPEYLKTDGGGAWGLYEGVFKVQYYQQVDHESKTNVDNMFAKLEGNFDRMYRLTIFEPATKKEYDDYFQMCSQGKRFINS